MAADSKKYVQFSKKVVIAVCISVTVITVLSIVLDFLGNMPGQATGIVKVYIQFAMVVFAAYSGNSAIQKWLIKKYSSAATSDTEDEND